MILHNLTEREDHPTYRFLEQENLDRQYEFLRSIITVAINSNQALSKGVITALNYHAIACLHPYAGEYRPCTVTVLTGGAESYKPPPPHRVPGLMEDFINSVNKAWDSASPIALAAYCLWRLNYIHPFINGNGRTARALCYYVLCVRIGNLLPGSTLLPELIRRNRSDYIEALKAVDESVGKETFGAALASLSQFVGRLLEQQLEDDGGDGTP